MIRLDYDDDGQMVEHRGETADLIIDSSVLNANSKIKQHPSMLVK